MHREKFSVGVHQSCVSHSVDVPRLKGICLSVQQRNNISSKVDYNQNMATLRWMHPCEVISSTLFIQTTIVVYCGKHLHGINGTLCRFLVYLRHDYKLNAGNVHINSVWLQDKMANLFAINWERDHLSAEEQKRVYGRRWTNSWISNFPIDAKKSLQSRWGYTSAGHV
jgi:hypothetical protein